MWAKYLGAVSIGFGSIVVYSGFLDLELHKYLLIGFGTVVTVFGTVMVANDEERNE